MPTFWTAPTANFIQKTLSGAITDVATTITLNNATNLQSPGYAVIDRTDSAGTSTPNAREVIYYTGISGNDLTGVTRGADGSTARSHSDGAIVETMPTIGMWNSLTTIVATAMTSDGYLKAIASPVSIARGQFTQFVTPSIASIARAEIGTFLANTWDGWLNANETWTYATATTITVPTNATTKYQKGDKIKLTQTTVKYFYIVAVAATTLTITGGSDYTLADAAISANYYSKAENPQGFPTWFNYTPTTYTWEGTTAPSGTPTYRARRFWVKGNVCHVEIYEAGYTAGTAITGVDITCPITPSSTGSEGTTAYAMIPPDNSMSVSNSVYTDGNTLRIRCASTAATGVRFMADYGF